MQSKTFALLALSASAVIASPFHRRAEFHRHRHYGTGTGSGIRPTGSGSPFQAGNDTDGFFAPTAAANTGLATLIITKTVSPLPEGTGAGPQAFGNAVEDASTSTSCTTTSIVTETSTNFVTVTATAAGLANTKVVQANSVSAGAFYGGQGSRSWGGGWGYNTPSAGASAPAASLPPSTALPSTTFATVTASAGASASSAVSSASSNSPSTGSSGGKRGISFNDAGLVSAFSNSVSWAYNWASTESGNLGNVEYVPMMWGKNDVSNFASKVGGATHVLGFNEPDLAEQADIDPQTAAQLHKQGMSSLVGKVKISSPAITNGDSQSPLMGIPWLKKWFEACAGSCPVDMVAFHWYATADSFDYFKQHVEDVIATAAANGVNKVWLTEFKPEGSADAQAAFMSKAIQYLDSKPEVERYAGFMASEGTLLSGGKLNNIGSAYAG